MKQLKYILGLALVLFLASLSSPAMAGTFPTLNECDDQVAAADIIIVEMGYGITRCGFHTQANPIEFACTVREGHTVYKDDFRNMMNQVYQKLGITNKGANPVLVIEPDGYNTWRRVDMANVLMGENQTPWMYVMWNSYIATYGNNKDDLGSALVYHADNNHSSIMPVVGGWPYDIPYAREFMYHEPEAKRRADSTFWTLADVSRDERGDLQKNIILSGSNWDGVTEAEIKAFEDRLQIQRINYNDQHIVNRSMTGRLVVWNSAKKICNDGILLSMDLAFQQSHFQSKGAEYIRQWVF